jgi:hypothetical protein
MRQRLFGHDAAAATTTQVGGRPCRGEAAVASDLAQVRQLQEVRGFVYDVDTGKLEEVSYPGAMGSIG